MTVLMDKKIMQRNIHALGLQSLSSVDIIKRLRYHISSVCVCVCVRERERVHLLQTLYSFSVIYMDTTLWMVPYLFLSFPLSIHHWIS